MDPGRYTATGRYTVTGRYAATGRYMAIGRYTAACRLPDGILCISIALPNVVQNATRAVLCPPRAAADDDSDALARGRGARRCRIAPTPLRRDAGLERGEERPRAPR